MAIPDDLKAQAMAAVTQGNASLANSLPAQAIPTAELGTGEAGHPTLIHGNYSQAAPAPAPAPTPEPGG